MAYENDFLMTYNNELYDAGQPSINDHENNVDMMDLMDYNQFSQIQVPLPGEVQYSTTSFNPYSPTHSPQCLVSSSQSAQFVYEGFPLAPISNPASPNISGSYNFDVSFNFTGDSKGSTWNYSAATEKLYVNRDVPCPINFSTDHEVPKHTYIRAVVFFTQPQYFNSVVQRCYNHSRDDELKGLAASDHLMCCDDDSVNYFVDKKTKRHSVVIPFNPCYNLKKYTATCIYRFLCLGSCSGSLNRRPIQIMFTLEKRNEVLGRKKVNLKICACPARDKSTEEMRLLNKTDLPQKTPIKRKNDPKKCIGHKVLLQKTKKSKTEGKPYIIKVDDRKCYEFLMAVRGFMASIEFRSDQEVSETTVTEESD